MLAQALSTVVGSGDWVTIKDLVAIAGADSLEFGNRLAQWEADGRIFSFGHKGTQLFPFHVLDPACSYQPFEKLSEIITVVATWKYGWLMACWLASSNSYLGGRALRTVLNSERDQMLSAVSGEVEGIMHG